MWFIDDGLVKNKNYYQQEMDKTQCDNTDLFLYYGDEFFNSLNGGAAAWKEIKDYLMRNRLENSSDIFSIPDFGQSLEIYNALLQLPQKYWSKLLSNNPRYDLLRKEMFASGDNLKRAKEKLGLA